MVNSSEKFTYLDGVRGLAAFAVVISHYMQLFYPAALSGDATQSHFKWDYLLSNTPLNLFYNGQFSVCLFFVLSGYVLSVKMFKSKLEDNVIRKLMTSSAMRRYIRLALPAAVSVMLVYFVFWIHGFYLKEIMEVTKTSLHSYYYDKLNTNIFFIIKSAIYNPFFTFASPPDNPVLWTMVYELLGSFLIFSFIALFGNVKKRWIVYLVLSLAFIQTYFIAFLWGMILADLLKNKWLKSNILIGVCLAFGLYLGSVPYIHLENTIYEPFQYFVKVVNRLFSLKIEVKIFAHILGSFLIIFSVLRSNILKSIFAWGPFAYLGKISFSIYLIHFTFIMSFSAYVFTKLNPHFSYNSSFVLMFVISMVPLFVLSHFYMKYIDNGSLIIAKKIENKMY